MNNTQMMLLIGAALLFSMLTLSSNRGIVYSTQVTYESEHVLTATQLGDAMVSEIISKAFDAATADTAITNINLLTSSASFGHNAFEVYPNYNDVDDYHRFTKKVDTPRLGVFDLYTEIAYVNELNPNQVIYTKSWMKRIKVRISHKAMPQPIIIYYFVSYY